MLVMKKYNILVTGVGAIIGYGIIKCLRKSKYKDNIRIIGIDIYSDAVGRNWCDDFQQGILAMDDAFPDFLKGVIENYNINLVIPGIEQDIESITNHFHTFSSLDTLFVLNRPELIRLCNDKWETFIFFKNEQVDMIKTYIDGDFDRLKDELGLPFLLKPRRSYASKGIRKIESATDYYYWKDKLEDNFMVQQIVGTDELEYTVGAFGLGDGTHSDIIVLKRKLAVDGATAKATVVQKPELDKYVDEFPTNLPYGLQRKLEIVRALSEKPKLLLLDEPAAGLNSADIQELIRLIRWIHETFDVTIWLIEHHMDVMMELCDDIKVIDFGQTIAEGTADHVRNHPAVISAYLGDDNI